MNSFHRVAYLKTSYHRNLYPQVSAPSSSVLTVGDLATGTVAVMERDSDGNLDRAARDGKSLKVLQSPQYL